mgnify:CR=1 FL=1
MKLSEFATVVDHYHSKLVVRPNHQHGLAGPFVEPQVPEKLLNDFLAAILGSVSGPVGPTAA